MAPFTGKWGERGWQNDFIVGGKINLVTPQYDKFIAFAIASKDCSNVLSVTQTTEKNINKREEENCAKAQFNI